jgi:hypothetical protein
MKPAATSVVRLVVGTMLSSTSSLSTIPPRKTSINLEWLTGYYAVIRGFEHKYRADETDSNTNNIILKQALDIKRQYIFYA